jgi:hypothetical protein
VTPGKLNKSSERIFLVLMSGPVIRAAFVLGRDLHVSTFWRTHPRQSKSKIKSEIEKQKV